MNRYYFSNNKKKLKPKKKSCKDNEEDILENLIGSEITNEQDDYNNNEYFLYSDISISSVMNILKFIKNAEKRWKSFLADYDDLIENAKPKPLKIFI